MNLTEELQRYQSELAPHFNPAILQREKTRFQVRFDEGQDIYLVVDGQQFSFSEGETKDPTLTLFVDRPETFWSLLKGESDSMRAFMEGRYRADGNIVLSQLLLYLFASKNPAVTYEVQD